MEGPGTIIRQMTLSDLPQVLEMEQEYFSDPWSRNIFLQSMALDYYVFLVASDKVTGEIQGYCSLMNAAGEGNIMNIAVKAGCRRRGIAGKLLKRLMEEGRKIGAEDFTLEVRVSNQPAIRLYEKMGFSGEGVRREYYEKPAEDALIMWKRKEQG